MVNQSSDDLVGYIKICPLANLATHTRFALTLRTRSQSTNTTSNPNEYHRLLLFRLSPLVRDDNGQAPELYCMESTCPHMGAPLSHAPLTVDPPAGPSSSLASSSTSPHSCTSVQNSDTNEQELIDETLNLALAPEMAADIEDLVEGRTITCPWHHYDFDLVTGESPVGIRACVYDVKVRTGDVWIEAPEKGHETGSWEVVEVKGVSEEFADPPVRKTATQVSPAAVAHAASDLQTTSSGTLPTLPRTLIQAAILILNTPNPTHKIELTRQANRALRQGDFQSIRPTKKDLNLVRETFEKSTHEAEGRRGFTPPREGLKEVEPWVGGKRGKGGNEKSRVLMIHALANIEQWAIDLAWDIIARYAQFEVDGEKLPVEFFLDWAKASLVAEDEAKHFSLLKTRLEELGSYYGAHTVHAGLWESALDTQDDLLARLAIIHLVHEARGLDVNPITIKKFEKAGDIASSKMMEVIHFDEITHVTTGHRWFTYICGKLEIDPVVRFRQLVRENFAGKIKGPFSVEDRGKAGMSGEWYESLEGHGNRFEGQAVAGEGDERVHPRLT